MRAGRRLPLLLPVRGGRKGVFFTPLGPLVTVSTPCSNIGGDFFLVAVVCGVSPPPVCFAMWSYVRGCVVGSGELSPPPPTHTESVHSWCFGAAMFCHTDGVRHTLKPVLSAVAFRCLHVMLRVQRACPAFAQALSDQCHVPLDMQLSPFAGTTAGMVVAVVSTHSHCCVVTAVQDHTPPHPTHTPIVGTHALGVLWRNTVDHVWLLHLQQADVGVFVTLSSSSLLLGSRSSCVTSVVYSRSPQSPAAAAGPPRCVTWWELIPCCCTDTL